MQLRLRLKNKKEVNKKRMNRVGRDERRGGRRRSGAPDGRAAAAGDDPAAAAPPAEEAAVPVVDSTKRRDPGLQPLTAVAVRDRWGVGGWTRCMRGD